MWTFIVKIVYSQKDSIVDACLGSKYAAAFWILFKRFVKIFYIKRLLKSESAISLRDNKGSQNATRFILDQKLRCFKS